ncbi:MAG TPA: FAD-dependent oxidoreductase [Ktedonobacteraceae bacterium]|nr:FAD-dependent oxidoreductase [Ktedonobacteraceae bacterium]
MKAKSIAIIGAGSSGLAAAHALQDAGHTVTLFEQSRAVGGRATTRKRDGFIYDSGAQYIRGGSPVSTALITERFRTGDLLDIAKPVWIFDAQGHIQEGDPQQNADPKWNYRSGLIALAQRMAEYLHVVATAIGHLEQTHNGWQLYNTTGHFIGTFESALVTIPAPQAVELIQFSQMAIELQHNITTHLQQARYNPLLSVMLGYSPTPETRPYYALVNTDKAHPISWLAWEHEKSPARAPANTGLLIAQMAPPYSRDHWQHVDTNIIHDVANKVSMLLNERLTEPVFTDIQRWPYALPSEKADAAALNRYTLPYGLAFCGDAFVGGRVHLALEHGMAVAQAFL